jgi:hypothetical protein
VGPLLGLPQVGLVRGVLLLLLLLPPLPLQVGVAIQEVLMIMVLMLSGRQVRVIEVVVPLDPLVSLVLGCLEVLVRVTLMNLLGVSLWLVLGVRFLVEVLLVLLIQALRASRVQGFQEAFGCLLVRGSLMVYLLRVLVGVLGIGVYTLLGIRVPLLVLFTLALLIIPFGVELIVL